MSIGNGNLEATVTLYHDMKDDHMGEVHKVFEDLTRHMVFLGFCTAFSSSNNKEFVKTDNLLHFALGKCIILTNTDEKEKIYAYT